MLIRVVEKPAFADITEIHHVVTLNETIDAFTTTIMQKGTSTECSLRLANIYQHPKTLGKQAAGMVDGSEYREGLKCTFQLQGG